MDKTELGSIAGLTFRLPSLPDAVELVLTAAVVGHPEGQSAHFVNAYAVACAANDAEYHRVLREASFVFPDSRVVTAALRSRSFGASPHASQVRGPSFFRIAVRAGAERGVRQFFFGSTPEVVSKLEQEFEEYPGSASFVGFHSPPVLDDWHSLAAHLPEGVNADTTDLIWVSLGTPKQDRVAAEIARRTGLTVAAVGAAFDMHAGVVREAPTVVQRLGLEWLFRFAQDPRRLWRRYTIGNFQFLRGLVRHRR